MALAVLDVDDVGVPFGVARLQEQSGELLVGELGAAADVVDLARAALGADELDALDVVVDVQPVADVGAVAVQRDRLARPAGW